MSQTVRRCLDRNFGFAGSQTVGGASIRCFATICANLRHLRKNRGLRSALAPRTRVFQAEQPVTQLRQERLAHKSTLSGNSPQLRRHPTKRLLKQLGKHLVVRSVVLPQPLGHPRVDLLLIVAAVENLTRLDIEVF
jgi:hypothetical protein